jgi:hypothetical protein
MVHKRRDLPVKPGRNKPRTVSPWHQLLWTMESPDQRATILEPAIVENGPVVLGFVGQTALEYRGRVSMLHHDFIAVENFESFIRLQPIVQRNAVGKRYRNEYQTALDRYAPHYASTHRFPVKHLKKQAKTPKIARFRPRTVQKPKFTARYP